MSDPRDPIDASLQRLFAPPDLAALQANIDAAAAAAELPRIEPTSARRPLPRGRARVLGIAALAAAAAAVLVLSAREHDVVPAEPDPQPAVPVVSSARRHAGAQLASFYVAGAALPRADDSNCGAPPPPPESCVGDASEPRLFVGADLELIGECGAPGGPSCEGHDLPTAHLVQLRVQPDGPDVLVCIEPRALDPQPLLPDDAGLSLFRRELGAFILYEITPLSEPRALDRFAPAQ